MRKRRLELVGSVVNEAEDTERVVTQALVATARTLRDAQGGRTSERARSLVIGLRALDPIPFDA